MPQSRKSCGHRSRTHTKISHVDVLDVISLTSSDAKLPLSEGTASSSVNRDNHADKKGHVEIDLGPHGIFTREVRTH
jgi:hypothetical protein